MYIVNQLKCCQVDYIKRYGKWAVITGGSDGIGLGFAKELARRGHSLVLIGLYQEELRVAKELLSNIENVGEIELIEIDLSDTSDENYDKIKKQIQLGDKDIGILINNVGTFVSKFAKFDVQDFGRMRCMINVNTLAPVYMTHLLIPRLIERGRGLIVNISSMSDSMTFPYLSVYGPTKKFVTALSRQLQAEYSNHPNLDIINVTPGAVKTRLYQDIGQVGANMPFIPSPDDYARSVTNGLGARIGDYTGYWMHGLAKKALRFLHSIGLRPYKLYVENNSKYNMHLR